MTDTQIVFIAGSALLGFLAATLFRYAIDLLLDWHYRNRDRRQLARQLLAEIRSAKGFICRQIELIRQEIPDAEATMVADKPDWRIPSFYMPIFEANADKLGLLEARSAERTIFAYTVFRHCETQVSSYSFSHYEGALIGWIKLADEVDQLLSLICKTSPHVSDKQFRGDS